MLENLYSAYIRMIYPRTPQEEVKYSYSDTSVEELIQQANSRFEVFKRKLVNAATSPDQEQRDDNQSVEALIELLGAVQTYVLTNSLPEDASISALQLIENFENLAQQEVQKILPLLCKEIEAKLAKHLTIWQNLVDNCTLKDDNIQTPEYWDLETESFVLYEGEEDYEEFLRKVKSNPKLLRVIDYWDYLDGLAHRYFLSRLTQLANGYCQIECYQKRLADLDARLKVVLLEGDILKDGTRQYFSKSLHWWYFYTPKNIFLYGEDF